VSAASTASHSPAVTTNANVDATIAAVAPKSLFPINVILNSTALLRD
jgi:hypothetical protein